MRNEASNKKTKARTREGRRQKSKIRGEEDGLNCENRSDHSLAGRPLPVPSVSKGKWRRMTGRMTNVQLARTWKEAVVAQLNILFRTSQSRLAPDISRMQVYTRRPMSAGRNTCGALA
jgi:hypothetical protein